MVEPRHVHWIVAKHVLRYLHGTVGYGLRYVSDGDVKLQGYTDSDWVGSVVDQEKHIRMLLQTVSGTQYNRGRVYSSQCCKS
jgi:hypothetical protein